MVQARRLPKSDSIELSLRNLQIEDMTRLMNSATKGIEDAMQNANNYMEGAVKFVMIKKAVKKGLLLKRFLKQEEQDQITTAELEQLGHIAVESRGGEMNYLGPFNRA